MPVTADADRLAATSSQPQPFDHANADAATGGATHIDAQNGQSSGSQDQRSSSQMRGISVMSSTVAKIVIR